MKNFSVNFEAWHTKLSKNITDFKGNLRTAVTQQFNLKFLKVMGVVLMIAAAISAIILSFMASTRAGLWCVAIEILMLLGLMIAGIRGKTYNNCLGILGKYILSILSIIAISYLIGLGITSLCPIKPMKYRFEPTLALGLMVLGLATIIYCTLRSEYHDGLYRQMWHNKTEYIVRILRKIILFAVGIGTIYALVYFLSPIIG